MVKLTLHYIYISISHRPITKPINSMCSAIRLKRAVQYETNKTVYI